MVATKSPAKVQPSNPSKSDLLLDGAAYPEPPLGKLYLTEDQLVAEFPKVLTKRKLKAWRSMRVGPPWSKFGRVVVYSREKVKLHIERNTLNLDRDERPPKPRRRAG